MELLFGTVSKEINSTLQPTVTHSIDCQLKDYVTIISPVFELRQSAYDITWNYCFIPKWGRYYFVHNITVETGGLIAVELAIDVLATWKGYIQSSTAYVSRSASNYSNLLPDPTWSHDDTYTLSNTTIDVGYNSVGCYLLFTASDDKVAGSQGVPSMTVYAITQTELKILCNYLFSDNFFDIATANLGDVDKTLTRVFFNPFQYIVKCMWIPFTKSEVQGYDHNIHFGWWDSGLSGKLLTGHYMEKTFSINLGSNNTWTDRDPSWTNISLYVPAFGQITISPEMVGRTLTGKIICDYATGQGGLFIRSGNNLIQSATGQIGADVQLSALYEDLVSDIGSKEGLIRTGITALGGAAAGGIRAGGGLKNVMEKIGTSFAMGYGYKGEVDLSAGNAGNVVNGIVSGAQSALQPTMSTIGANGVRAIIERENNAILTITKYSRYEDIHTRLGGVCNKVLSLSTLSGYTEVVNPHVNAPATSEEITMINQFLSGGFYIE